MKIEEIVNELLDSHEDEGSRRRAAAVQAFAQVDLLDEHNYLHQANDSDAVLPFLLDEEQELADFTTDALSMLDESDEGGGDLENGAQADAEGSAPLDDSLLQHSYEALPEIDMIGTDDAFLAPIENLTSVFDDFAHFRETKDDQDQDDGDDDDSKAWTKEDEDDESNSNTSIANDFDDNADFQPSRVLDQLGKLTMDTKSGAADEYNEQDINNDNVNDDNYFVCQPCTPINLQMQWKEEDSRLAIEQKRLGLGPVTDQDLEEMMKHFAGGLDLEHQLTAADLRLRETLMNESSTAGAVTSTDHAAPTQPSPVRPAAMAAAKPWLEAFAQDGASSSKPTTATNPSEQVLLGGHRERILGMDLDESGRYLATASQDSNVCVWDVCSNKLLRTLPHNAKFECLRVAWASSTWADQVLKSSTQLRPKYLLATGTAEGVVLLFGTDDPANEWKCLYTIEHSDFNHVAPQDEDDKPQIYALQFIDHYKALPSADDDVHNSFLMTSSNDCIHFWELDAQKRSKVDEVGSSEHQLHLREVMSLRFTHLHGVGYGVRPCQVTGRATMSALPSAHTVGPTLDNETATNDDAETPYGGAHRNPNHFIFVFDASYCSTNSLLGAALSDGSLRLMNGRGVCLSALQLPGVQSHLTSFCWDTTGTRLATSVATGYVVVWSVINVTVQNSGYEELKTSCLSAMQGGHELDRPLFGVAFCGGEQEELLLSWGVDGRLCLWDCKSDDADVYAPLATLLDRNDYPIYATAFHARIGLLAIGGGADGGFIGIPAYLYKIANLETIDAEHADKKAKSTESTDQEEDVATKVETEK
ncbi:hypothetical protein MPSEU_000830000 [Mayamaea pseudoterrestris]|nr:hypothetical protein MPSEU_000830000 [Mayamaea pseudoterrestris]